MRVRSGPSAMGQSSTVNRFSRRSDPDTRTFNANAGKAERGRAQGMPSWLTLEGDLAGTIFPRQAPVVVGREVGVKGAETTGTMKRNSTRAPAVRLAEGEQTAPRATALSTRAVARRDTNPYVAPIRSVACVVGKGTRRRARMFHCSWVRGQHRLQGRQRCRYQR